MNDRDKRITQHILRHCAEIMSTVKRFDSSRENFNRDHVFYNACSMSLFQIGELSKRMSEDFKNVAFHKNMAPPLEVPYSFLRYLLCPTQVLNRAAA